MNIHQKKNEIVNYHYDAFISYRHLPKDKKAAIRLQQLLEKHKRSDGRALRVFRDQSEFSASSDLGADIRRALEESRYLIIICSPAYKDSKWCIEEITYFRQLQGGSKQHILIMLVEGELNECIPEQLKWESDIISTSEYTFTEMKTMAEPLCADIRAVDERKMMRHLHTEYLRIAAPLLECSFDNLYQRSQRQKRKKVWITAAAITTAAIAFSCYTLYMLERISQKQQELYANESQRLAVMSNLQCENEDYCLAMLLAEEALPQNIKKPERPFLTEAEEALRSTVTQRIESESYPSFQILQQINFSVSSWTICRSYDEGRKLAVSDYENTYLYDVATGMLLFSCQGHEVYFNNDATRAARIQYKYGENGVYDAIVELYTTKDGELYFSGQYKRENNEVAGMWDEATDCCYILYKKYGDMTDEKKASKLVLLEVLDKGGSRLENVTLSQKLEEKFDNGYMYSYFDSRYYGSSRKENYDYSLEGIVTERAVGFEELLLEKTKEFQELGYNVLGVEITDDRELALFKIYSQEGFYSNGNKETMASIVYSLKNPGEEGGIETLAGDCYLDRSNGLIYQRTHSKLCILTYHPENFANQEKIDRVERLSTDGKYCLGSIVFLGTNRTWLKVWNTNPTKEPLMEIFIASDSKCDRYLYYTTLDMEFVFLQTDYGALELWSPKKGLVRSFHSDIPSETITSLTVNKDGTLIAYSGIENGSDIWIEIRSAIDGALVQRYEFSEASLGVTHLEFWDDYLLVATEQNSRIYFLNKEQPLREIPSGSIGLHYDCCLTEDGLLLSTMRTNKPCELSGIYDVKTGKQLFGRAQYFEYNPERGMLVYQPINGVSDNSTSVHVARRREDGQFEDVYVITPEDMNMTLKCIPQSMDEKYFLLNGSESCEVYDTVTGSKVLTLRGNSYLLLNGMLYDQRMNGSGKLLRYPIMDLDELKEKAHQFLTSDLGTRELTQAEKKQYFIP